VHKPSDMVTPSNGFNITINCSHINSRKNFTDQIAYDTTFSHGTVNFSEYFAEVDLGPFNKISTFYNVLPRSLSTAVNENRTLISIIIIIAYTNSKLAYLFN